MLRTMLSVGITEDLQISGSLPITLNSGIYMPSGRIMAMMSSNQDLEAIVGWRFQRRAVGAGRTARVHGLCRRDGAAAAVPLRRHAGGAFGSRVGGERLRVADALFLGRWRLSALRRARRRPDGRQRLLQRRLWLSAAVSALGLSEAGPAFLRRGRRRAHATRDSITASRWSSSGGDSILVGPTALLLYKQYGLEAGLLFPVYQQTNFQPEEKFRFGVNFTYFFWRK